MKFTCDARPQTMTPRPPLYPSTSSLDCTCSSEGGMNLTSSDSRVLSKHKTELGMYKFDGKFHEGRPYFVKKNASTITHYIYLDKSHKTWYLSNTLGSTRPS